MALARRSGQRFQTAIWPGFVDAMTGLLLVLMFVLTIFMIVQFVLRETISGQESELNQLAAEVAALTQTLGLEEARSTQLQDQLGALRATLAQTEAEASEQAAQINSLLEQQEQQQANLTSAEATITDLEARIAALLVAQSQSQGKIAELTDQRDEATAQQEALVLALAQSRSEIDAQTEAARLAAARREALEALIADLRARNRESQKQVSTLDTKLSEAEAERLTEAAAAEALRSRLENASLELTAMTLALEQQREQAETTLTLLAAAEAVRDTLTENLRVALMQIEQVEDQLVNQNELQQQLEQTKLSEAELQRQVLNALAARDESDQIAAEQLSLAEQRAKLLQIANLALSEEEAAAAESRREVALLNQQIAALRAQLASLQSLLDDARERDKEQNIQIEALGSDLNLALAQAAAEQNLRRRLEEAERLRLEAEAEKLAQEKRDLESYRSEFFGRMREVLAGQDRIRVVGDRFVFSSEVLFPPAQASLSAAGQQEIASVARILFGILDEIPSDIDWIIQVDGHTDDRQLSGDGLFADNWQLSQARALSVVRYMVEELDFPPEHLSANGFGEHQPINPANTSAARAQNRRIELKLTER
ncbi:MAG: peptidoglycan -binding protein [Aestuariivita sp.]|nr:peptidoglycan -binding protein [Aestuariivita sp.]MCY4347413.1 peptidoglycan -binding protein [Aestuariivita sp.]